MITMSNKDIFQISNLVYRYNKKIKNSGSWLSTKNMEEQSQEFQLGPIDLNIKKGRLTAILGRSGSGKTTLLSIIGLLRQAEKGRISIFLNQEVLLSELWKDDKALDHFRSTQLGFALQRGELLPHLSLFENAALVSTFINKDPEQIDQGIQNIFQDLYEQEYAREKSLDRVMNKKPSGVSQGQYQRGAIARALANDPSIILADEPTGNLDIHAGAKAMAIFRNVVRKNKDKSVIVVTHDRKLAVDFADAIVILKEGKVRSTYEKDLDTEHWERTFENEVTQAVPDRKTLMDQIGNDLD